MTIVRASITEKAAGEFEEQYQNLCTSGLERKDQQSTRSAAKEAVKVAWQNHHRATYEATKRFLKGHK